MKPADTRIPALSARLQADLLALAGRGPVPPRELRAQLLPLGIALGLMCGAALLVRSRPQAARRLLLGLTLQAAGAALRMMSVRDARS